MERRRRKGMWVIIMSKTLSSIVSQLKGNESNRVGQNKSSPSASERPGLTDTPSGGSRLNLSSAPDQDNGVIPLLSLCKNGVTISVSASQEFIEAHEELIDYITGRDRERGRHIWGY